jgi:hypothetical protein
MPKLASRAFDAHRAQGAPPLTPLQTLYLKLNVFNQEGGGTISPLCTSILRLSAPTLVSLNWETLMDHSLHSLIAGSKDPP